MGARGPKTKPTELKLLTGTYRPDRDNKNTPKPEISGEVPAPPSYFDNTAKKEWKRLAPILHKLGLLTVADYAMFEAYCLSYGRMVQAQKDLKKAKAMTYEYINKAGAKNIVPRPEIAMIQKESIIIKTLCAEFGLTPSARTRMEVPDFGGGGPAKETDEFEDFLNAKKKRTQ